MVSLLESIQCGAGLIISSTYKCTKHENLIQELGLSLFGQRRTFSKLMLFYKMKNNLTPAYMSNLCPPEVADRTEHNLRNARDMDNITSSKQYFLKSYLPSTVKLWNKLPNDIKMSQSVEIFRDKLSLHLKMCTIYKPYLYSPNKNFVYIGRLRMGLSALNAHRRKYHFIQNAECPHRPNKKEDTLHYLLQCHHYTAECLAMLNSLVDILPIQHRNLLLTNRKQDLIMLSKLLVYGLKENDELALEIFTIVALFIEKTGRFI